MKTMTIRIPDDKHDRLKTMADNREVSLNRLMDELATMAIAEFDAHTRFTARAKRGSPKRGLALLNKLDA